MNERNPDPVLLKGVSMDIVVSVIVITYNHRPFIQQAIEGILNQKTEYPYEILIGDDASTDGTSDIVRQYAEEYPDLIHAVIHPQNIGSTRNAYSVLSIARGKYLATCEGDDYWIDSNKIQKQVDFLEKHPQYSGCVHPIICVNEDGKRIRGNCRQWISGKREFSINDFDGCTLPGHTASIVRRNYFLDPGFNGVLLYQANPYIGDRTCALLWLARGNYYQLDDKMACYRIRHKDNLTTIRYRENQYRLTNDYEYTLVLEQYATDKLRIPVDFSKHKRDLFAKAFLLSLYKRNFPEKKLMQRIIRENGNPVWYYAGIVPYIFKRIMK